MIAGTVGKIANEFINLERTEICEVEESFAMGKVGSSTMPHKRNPMVCENILANVRIVQANAALSFGAMIQEHERDMSFWQTEWSYIPQICIMLDGSMKAFEEDWMLLDVLMEDERVTSKISEDVLRELLEPVNYTGSCAEFVNRAVEKWGEDIRRMDISLFAVISALWIKSFTMVLELVLDQYGSGSASWLA